MIKVKGSIKGREVVLLIDGGATHNFITEELVAALQLLILPTEGYRVVLGTGGSIRSTSVCKGVFLSISDLCITHDFLPLPLGSADVILGVVWLETLGKIEMNYRTSVMEFTIEEWLVQLCGNRSLVKFQISLKSMMKSLGDEDHGRLVELNVVAVETGDGDTRTFQQRVSKFPKEIWVVFASYEQVFTPTPRLPPARDHDHTIELVEGTGPINVRPDRYP